MLEQDPDDRELTEIISKETAFNIGFRFFAEQPRFFQTSDSTSLPRIIILSYNSIPYDKITVLKLLKADKPFMHMPAIILSDSITDNALHGVYIHAPIHTSGSHLQIRIPFIRSLLSLITGLTWWNRLGVLAAELQKGRPRTKCFKVARISYSS